jgi:hypothetical protein
MTATFSKPEVPIIEKSTTSDDIWGDDIPDFG